MKTTPWLLSVLVLALAGTLAAQTTGAPTSPPGPGERASLRLRIETWEVPAIEILRRMDGVSSDAVTDPSAWLVKLRQDCLKGAIPSARLIQSPVVATDEAEKVLAESNAEELYPVAYEPPNLPNPAPTPESQWAEATAFMAPSIMECRTTGTTLENEIARVKTDKNAWDVRVSLEDSALVKMRPVGPPADQIVQPEFSTTHTGGTLRLREGQWQLLSVKEAPRPSGVSEPSENRLITVIRIDRES